MEDLQDDQAVVAIQHPLENQLILDLVLAYLQPLATFQDWKHIRIVCKTWYFHTLVKWRATAILNLKLGPALHNIQPEIPGVSMSEFLTLIENDHGNFSQFTEKPFQNYKIQNLVLDVFNVKNNNLFWTSVGPNITHLSLDEVNIKMFTQTFTNTMIEVMEFFVNQIPNLESFAVSNLYFDGTRKEAPPRKILVAHPNVKTLSISNCFAFGFANFPNLKEVTLKSCTSNGFSYLVDSNPPAIQGLAVVTNSSIQRLTLDKCPIDARQFRLVRFTALKHLSLDRHKDIRTCTDVLTLSEFIKNHAKTLETIEAFGTLTKSPLTSTCMIDANLLNLTELRAWGNVFATFNFIRHTPNLKLLHLDMYGFEKQEKTKEDLGTGSEDGRWYVTKWDLVGITKVALGDEQISWRHLHYFQINQELKKESLETLAKWMPNLRTLKTVLNKDTFPVVCENWPELEHLECLFGSSILNENITGIDNGPLDGQRSRALSDMESLKTFKLQTECNTSLLSDESVAKGFLRMPKLNDLSICVSAEFTEEAEILLRRGVRNVQLYRNYVSNPLHKNWQCCRDKEYKSFIFRPEEPTRRTEHSRSFVIRKEDGEHIRVIVKKL